MLLLILTNYEKLYAIFEGLLFYLQKHFSTDPKIEEWLITLLTDEKLLFHHVIALVFKFFPNLRFIEQVYQKYSKENTRHWLVRYFMINWLFCNKKREIILTDSTDNYFINRELNSFKIRCSKDISFKKIFANKLLESKDSLTALQGFYLFQQLILKVQQSPNYNSFVRSILENYRADYINHILSEAYTINSSENFFNCHIWNDEQLYQELNHSFFLFHEFKDIDPSKALLNLNSFNNLVFEKICEQLNILPKSKDYGVNLHANYLFDKFPITNRYFLEINEQRNQRSEAHPYDKYGQLRIRINFDEFKKLIEKETKSLKEICAYKF